MLTLMRMLICFPVSSLERKTPTPFKQRNLKETQDFGRDFQMTPEEGRYPSPITWHCEFLPVVAIFMLSLFVRTREVWGMSHTGTPVSPLKDTSCAGQESLT